MLKIIKVWHKVKFKATKSSILINRIFKLKILNFFMKKWKCKRRFLILKSMGKKKHNTWMKIFQTVYTLMNFKNLKNCRIKWIFLFIKNNRWTPKRQNLNPITLEESQDRQAPKNNLNCKISFFKIQILMDLKIEIII